MSSCHVIVMIFKYTLGIGCFGHSQSASESPSCQRKHSLTKKGNLGFCMTSPALHIASWRTQPINGTGTAFPSIWPMTLLERPAFSQGTS